MWERQDEVGGEWEGAFEDVWCDFLRIRVDGSGHFEFGVEVIDVVEGKGFGGFGEDGRAKFVFAVVAGDEVEEVEAYLFG